MERLQELLSRYTTLTPPQEAVQKAVVESIKAACGAELSTQRVTTRGKTVLVSADPTTKKTLLIHQKEILRRINEALGGRRFTAIK